MFYKTIVCYKLYQRIVSSIGKALVSPTAKKMGKQALKTAASVGATGAMMGFKGVQGMADAMFDAMSRPEESSEEYSFTRTPELGGPSEPLTLGGPSEPLTIADVFRPQLEYLERAEARDEGEEGTSLRRSSRATAGVAPKRYGFS